MRRDAERVNPIKLRPTLCQGQWLIVAATATFVALAAAYPFAAVPWFPAGVVLVSADNAAVSSLAPKFGGLASFVGIGIGEGDQVEPLAALRSRDFAGAFIESENLMTRMVWTDWDATGLRWKSDDSEEVPGVRDCPEVSPASLLLPQAQDVETSTKSLAVGQGMRADLTSAQPTDRMSMNLPGMRQARKGSSSDVVLNDGDKLFIPKASQYVTLLSEVQSAAAHLYQANLNDDDDLKMSDGPIRRADSK